MQSQTISVLYKIIKYLSRTSIDYIYNQTENIKNPTADNGGMVILIIVQKKSCYAIVISDESSEKYNKSRILSNTTFLGAVGGT